LRLEFRDLLFRHELVADLLDAFGIEHLVVDRHHDAVDLDLDRRPGREEHVRSLLVGHQLEERGYEHDRAPEVDSPYTPAGAGPRAGRTPVEYCATDQGGKCFGRP